jgi:ComF family protein
MATEPLVLRLAADLLCPERCAACEAVVNAQEIFCHACRAAVNVLGPPECARCGAPSSRTPCSGCRVRPDWPIRCARSWAAYDGAPSGGATTGIESVRPVARALIAFKYGGAQRLGRRFARVMAPRAPFGSCCVIVPVPLHRSRLRQRGFNQSAVLARQLARALDWPVALRMLVRIRDTPSQTALTVAERAANVAGAFAVRSPASVRERSVLLVDDVWTSGATACAAAAALADAGAARIDVLTFARVL